jgi:hypothetical protein
MIKQFYKGWGYIAVTYKGKRMAWFGAKAECELKYSNWMTMEQMA